MARERTRGRAGSDIELYLRATGGGSKAAAYHAIPAAGRGKGVLVLGETDALDEFARDACDRLARAGFAALAPDLPRAGDAAARIDAAIRQLLDDHATDGPRVGALGFEQGAARLLAFGDAERRIGCIVACAGVASPQGDASEPRTDPAASPPTLLLMGDQDARLAEARRLERAPAATRLVVLPGAGAGFMIPARADDYAAAAAAAAWDAALAFLGAAL